MSNKVYFIITATLFDIDILNEEHAHTEYILLIGTIVGNHNHTY